MQRTLLALCALLIATPCLGDEMLWQVKEVTGTVYYGRQTPHSLNCRPSIRRSADGTLYRRRIDCPDEPGLSDIGIPLDDYVNKASRREAKHLRVLPNGNIQLY
jgi:hypothetical protein